MKKKHCPPRWIYITHIWSPTLFPRCTPTYPSNISRVSSRHCTYTHLPMKHTQTVTISKFFILGTATHPSDISKVSPYHCTYTHPPTYSYNVKIFHFRNTHPHTEHTESVTLSLYMYPPTHEQLQCQNLAFH